METMEQTHNQTWNSKIHLQPEAINIINIINRLTINYSVQNQIYKTVSASASTAIAAMYNGIRQNDHKQTNTFNQLVNNFNNEHKITL